MLAHFIGSIVYLHDDVYTASGLTELTIIDGQQRLTTVTLIYATIYRLAQRIDNKLLESQIQETYLINKFAPEEEKLKLKPTEDNDKAIKFILQSEDNDEFNGFSRIVDNYNYFKSVINESNYNDVLQGLSKLIFVDISLDRQKDNPQRIFESLNSTGLELTQADLIRNYILMGLPRRTQDRIYKKYWDVIETLAKDKKTNKSRVSDFFRDFLTLKNKDIPNKNKVYQTFKSKYPTSTESKLEETLTEIKSLVRFYNKMINPDNEQDKGIRTHLEYLKRLEINVAYPFLVKVYEDYANEIINKETFIEILELTQSFAWRRFILGFGTEGRNKIFMSLYDKVDLKNYLNSIKIAFMKLPGNSRFPRNAEVINALKKKDVYNIKSKNSFYFLERLENFNNNEPVVIASNSDITIEHIFPQNPNPKWKIELGNDEYRFIKENYLNTIGNLTLSGNNGKLGNKTFIEKRDLPNAGYKDSRLWLNKYLSVAETWNKTEIERRIDLISERFLDIWWKPDIVINEKNTNEEINIFDAEQPKNKKLEYAIFFNQKIETNQVSKLYSEIFSQLFDLNPETFFTSEIGIRIGISKKTEDMRQPISISETYFIEGNLDNISKFDRIKQALSIFGFEDELIIKYADSNNK
ncbi:MAG: DUF262 domain-containing protein [Bacteroidales bacterium]|nr:DUF262 domain-containing protein [Bacteroidales bacterium]